MWMCERAHVTSYWRVHHLEGELLTLHFITFCVWKNLEPSFILEQLSQSKCEVACQASTISYHHPFWSGYVVQGVHNLLWKNSNKFCWLFWCGSIVEGDQSFTWKRHKGGKSKIKRSASSDLCVFLSFIHCAHYGLDLVNCVRHCAANLFHIKLESMGGLKILAFFEGDAGLMSREG